MNALIVAAGVAGFYVLCAALSHTPLANAPVFDWLGLGVVEGEE